MDVTSSPSNAFAKCNAVFDVAAHTDGMIAVITVEGVAGTGKTSFANHLATIHPDFANCLVAKSTPTADPVRIVTAAMDTAVRAKFGLVVFDGHSHDVRAYLDHYITTDAKKGGDHHVVVIWVTADLYNVPQLPTEVCVRPSDRIPNVRAFCIRSKLELAGVTSLVDADSLATSAAVKYLEDSPLDHVKFIIQCARTINTMTLPKAVLYILDVATT